MYRPSAEGDEPHHVYRPSTGGTFTVLPPEGMKRTTFTILTPEEVGIFHIFIAEMLQFKPKPVNPTRKTKNIDTPEDMYRNSVIALMDEQTMRGWLNDLQDLFSTLFETLEQQRAAAFQQLSDAFEALFETPLS
ncbi:hypothetical protein Tco_1298120 [Tanacetum coccineum]